MNSSRSPHTRPVPGSDDAGPDDAAFCVRLAERGLRRVSDAIDVVGRQRPRDDRGHESRARRLGVLHARWARWWVVLERATCRAVVADDIPMIYIHAVVIARLAAESDARFWRETADDWAARITDQPTSDAAGAMSNRDDLGVTELGRPHLAAVPAVCSTGGRG